LQTIRASYTDRPVWSRRADWIQAGLLAALAYIPIFFTRAGQVAADTKEYLYLDPARLTTSAASMWDPNTGLGTVTHQNIGYLLPMGPYYTAVSWLGIPMWVGQRFWMGSLLFAAGTGVLYCARRLGLEGPGRFVAAVAYMLSPYVLDYLDRISAILMPWAALGWMIGLTIGAARSGRWRQPALFALVVALVGGVNATSIVLVIAAPAAWLIYAAWVTKEISVRRAAATAGRLALLCVGVSLWWVAGLWAEGKYGINILRVTETVPTVSKTSSAAEVLRGLGYWYFYGWDKVQPWTLQAVPYTQSPWLLVVSMALPAIGIVLGLITRWVYRGYCLLLVGVGTVVAVGAFPFSDPSVFGAMIKGASAGSSLALAMRSVDRIVPIVVVGLALLMGSGVTALYLRRPTTGLVTGGVCLALLGANLPALWTGGLIASNLSRPGAVPSYWTDAAAYLNSLGSASRVLGLPGEDFAAYSWGVTEDPIPPGLLDRPYVSRQVVPAGTPASANLLQALDEPIQEGTIDPAAIAPLARLISAGQILLQSDLQYERYHLPFPQILYSQLTAAQAGLGTPRSFGAPDPAPQIRYPMDTELRLGIPTGTPQPPALSVFDISDPRSLVRTEDSADPVILSGDGAGMVEAAGAGLLNGDGSIFYAASLRSGTQSSSVTSAPATLVLTDTNPLTTYLWGSLQANQGEIQQPGVADIENNPSDYSLPVFPGETAADQTVAEVSGVSSVRATQYGDSLTFTPEFKPLNALDGNPDTAWSFGSHEPVNGVTLDARLLQPVTTDHVTLHQLGQLGQSKRRITAVTLKFDGHDAVRVNLTDASLSAAGQTVAFPVRTFSDFQLVVDGATGGRDKRYDGLPQVGFTEISIPGVGPAAETRRLPTDLFEMVPNSIDDPIDILMQRSRVVGTPRQDPEPTMSRTFTLPGARSFSVGGTAEINAADSDYLIDQLIGLNQPAMGTTGPAIVVSANSSTRLVGDRSARANAAVDGDPDTAWIAESGNQDGDWLSVELSHPISFDHLDLQILNDGRHSLPTRITITTESGSRTVEVRVPPVGAGRPQNATTTVPVDFPVLSGSTVKVTIDAVQPVEALDYYSTFAGLKDVLPVGIAELGLPGVVQPAAPEQIPTVCTGALLQIDGNPVDVEVTGSTPDALGGQQLSIEPCGNSRAGIQLGPGTHIVTTSPHLPSGWSVDQVWLGSGAGGGAVPVASIGEQPGSAQAAATVVAQDRTSLTVKVRTTGSPQWLVLGQSFSTGWHASVAGGANLGAPRLIDAYANGWYLPAQPAGGTLLIHINWQPQTVIWTALTVSAASILLCGLIAVWPVRSTVTGRAGRRNRNRYGSGPTPASAEAFLRLSGPHRRVRLLEAVVAAVGWGLVTTAVSRPATGVMAGVAVAVAVSRPWGRVACRVAAVVALLALPVYTVSQQVVHRYWPDINWPANMSSANDLAWLGLALLGSDLVAGAVYARGRMQGPT
jgi:arabinofuranan 3-O-arabinosyltransferase